jgi:hypothetical protein
MKVKAYIKSEIAGFYGNRGSFKKSLRQLSVLDLPPNISLLTPIQDSYIFQEIGIRDG